MINLCIEKRGVQKQIQYLGGQVQVTYELPLAEVVLDFFDRLKSASRGYASFEYEFKRFQASDLVKLDVLINGEHGGLALDHRAPLGRARPAARTSPCA